MKQFSLDEYLANPSRKVVTREGRNARIICTDFKTKHHSVLALIDYGEYEFIISRNKEGRHYNAMESENDLFFAPEKHEGWINIFKSSNDIAFLGQSCIFESKEDAENGGKGCDSYAATIKIEWEG